MEFNEQQKNILLNLLLEKMQSIAERKNTDEKKALGQYKKDLHEVYGAIINAIELEAVEKVGHIEIEKTITVCVDYEDLQAISWELNTSDYWADLKEIDESTHMRELITDAQYNLLKSGGADYIVFKEN